MKHKATCNWPLILVIWCQFFLYVSAENDKKTALVFHRFDDTISEIPSDMPSDLQCNSWASACPAENDADDKFIASTAFTKNTLFVKATCTKDKTVEEAKFKTNICKNSFKISALFNKETTMFGFGYEIYYGVEYNHLFKKYTIEKYFSAEDVFTELNKSWRIPPYIFDNIKQDYKRVAPSSTEIDFWYNKDRKLRFMWINLFNIKFDHVEWTPRRIFYHFDEHNRWPTTWSCQRYDLVAAAYEKVDLDHLYSEGNQNEIFSDLQLPEKTSDAACESTCVTKWLLIPAHHFNFGSEENSVCPNMATVPIWTSTIKEVMIKLEKYLYALYQVAGNHFYVISGTAGQLQMTRKNTKSIFSLKGSKAKVFLDMKNETPRVPVPNILYKIIQYKPSNCLKYDSCWYLATIVIHNDPNFDPENDKICDDVTSDWGWTEVTKITVQKPDSEPTQLNSPFIYVCQTNPQLVNNFLQYTPRETLRYDDLNLNLFSFYDADHQVDKEPIVDRVFATFKKLSDLERENMDNMLPVSDITIDNLRNDDENAPILDILSEDIRESGEVDDQYDEVIGLLDQKRKK